MLACAKYLALNSVFHTDFCYHDDFLSQQGQGVKVGRWSRSSDQGGKSRRCKQRKCQISTIFSGGITITKRSIKPFEGTTPFSFRGAQHLNLIRSLKWNSIQFVSFFLRV